MVVSGKNTMELIIAARDRTGGAFRKVRSHVAKLGVTSEKVTGALKGAAKAGALIGAAAVVAGIVGSTKAFMDFEDAMANVRKTTGLTKEKIEIMGEAINSLALKIPVAQTELAGIAATAGQLGIVGQKNIMSFTETVAKMTTAFDMSADSVAIAMAKLTNIYDIPIAQVGNLGSAINVLGNTTAASESQLMAFSMSLGPTGQQLGFTATEALSLGASMVSIGMDASAAGTRLSRAFSMIGQNLDELAGFMGVSTEEFTASFEDMPMETFMGVLEKLSQVEGKLKANTIASELFNEIGAKAIKGLTGDLDGLKTNLDNSAEGFKANISLNEEFAAKTDTLKARFQLLKNSVNSLLIEIGGELAPTLNTIIDGVRNIIPPLKDLLFEIGSGFSEMFESITRQAGPALDPLIKKVKEAGDKISAGLNFRTLLDDIGVFIGAGLNPLIRGFTWLIDKLGPLWELIGKGAKLFHDLANVLKTEEGRLDDILDATEKVTKAKQDLFDINEKLRGNVETLADALEKAGGWTTTLADLEADAKNKTDALAVARQAASEAIAVHGADSEIARIAIENVKLAEEGATIATNDFNTAVNSAAGSIIDSGVATEGLEKAQLDFTASTEEAIITQGELKTAVTDLETELKEAKVAPLDLGEAFISFGKKVAGVFLELPLKILESFLKIQESIAGGLDKIGLGAFAEKFDGSMEFIKERIATVREGLETNIEDPLLEDIPKASEAMKDAITGAADAIVRPAKRAKEGVEGVNSALKDTGITAEDAGDSAEKAFTEVEVAVDKVTGKVTILTDNLEETTDTFVSNAEAAETLINLDWDVFSKLEADLPNINSGIGDMASAFKGLEGVLIENLENLEAVKGSVEGIGRLTTPFLEEGFMSGIKSIGSFANTLKDAGSAINAFSSLQEVSIDGMINFSLHVNDMVSALEILESQMEDLMPAFGDMDSLITNVVDSFIWTGGRKETIADELNRVAISQRQVQLELDTGLITWEEYQARMKEAGNVTDIMAGITSASFGTIYDYYERYITSTEDIDEVTQDFLNTSGVAEKQMDKQTNALAAQTAQLSKITDALEPYLNFMRTLNEIAALTALSTEELNSGLEAIEDTLNNLGSALSKFDLSSIMESLFGTKITEGDLAGKFTGGLTTGFTDVMLKYQTPLHNLMTYVERLTGAISGLVISFKALEDIGNSILADQVKIKEVFRDMLDIMTNFSMEMGGIDGFAEKFATGMVTMVKSADPLMVYFQDNNAAVTLFNSTLLTFKSTLSNVIDTMKMLKDISEMTAPSVEELGAGFDAASKFVRDFNEALMGHVGAREGQWDMEKYYNSIFETIKNFAKDWDALSKDVKDSFETFGAASGTITSMINNVLSLSGAFTTLGTSTVATAKDMERSMRNLDIFIARFTDVMASDLGLIVDNLIALDIEWSKYSKNMEEVMPSFKAATSDVSALINTVTSLNSAFKSLSEMSIITSAIFDKGFSALIKSVSNFAGSLSKNVGPMIESLQELRRVWIANENVLVPLMRDFQIITKNLKNVADNANAMTASFRNINTGWIMLERGFDRLIKFIKTTVEAIKEFYTPEAAAEVSTFIKDIGTVIKSFEDLNSKIESALNDIKNKIRTSVENIETNIKSLENLNSAMFYSGQNLISSLINGMNSMQTALAFAAGNLADIIKAYLGVESPTERGALMDLDVWPKNLVRSFSKGIEAEMGGLNVSLGTMVAPPVVSEGGGGGNRTSVSFTIHQNIKDRATADYTTNELEKMLRRHVV